MTTGPTNHTANQSPDRFTITRRFYPHFVNYDDQHDEAHWRTTERRLDFAASQCALVLVDIWNTNEIGFERFDGITKQQVKPVVEAFRAAGILVIHTPSPSVANKYPARRFKPSHTEQGLLQNEVDSWPAPEMLSRTGAFKKYSLKLETPGVRQPRTEEELYRNYFIHPAVEPVGDDVVVGDREELHALLKARRKFHLFYAGFSSNGCIQERDYGVKGVYSILGYDVTLIRDCTAGLEMAHTLATLEQTRASIENMEFWISTCTSTDLLSGLQSMQQATAQ